MNRLLAVLPAALVLALGGGVPSDFMLCFHRDGKMAVERFQELCCEPACPEESGAREEDRCPAECPDDQCHDVPLKIGLSAQPAAPAAIPAAPPMVDVPLVDPASLVPALIRRPFQPLSGFLDPPDSFPLAHLRVIVLRI